MIESQLLQSGIKNIAGVDEAGRGPVIGPLVIAGVVINKDDLDKLVEQGLTDSKLLTKEQRNVFYDKIFAVLNEIGFCNSLLGFLSASTPILFYLF